ncbi:MAG: PAS domain-containing protein [Alphaproteobacteria bacterium]|nr:PAS domain-containing protein [Alphaproteobacteria bacterium]
MSQEHHDHQDHDRLGDESAFLPELNVDADAQGRPIVGIGASAGGLEAFQAFLEAASPDAGVGYVLVQHLDPNHESMLAELLRRRTSMPVRQAENGDEVEANHVYLIPPNASMTIEGGRLKLTDFAEPRGYRRPIDVFFRSLAADQGANAACIVLSGTGADGAEGLRCVKDAGGLTLAQDPATAKYDGMPNSAVATGLVDKVLSVQAMPEAVRAYFSRRHAGVVTLTDVSDFLLGVCEILRRQLGHDFSQYKRSTMLRRIQRRMQVVGAMAPDDYLARLRDHPDEPELLFRDLLINVTSFFRDSEAFDVMRRIIIPQILDGKGAHDPVRIWVAGCSSGEEAYSIAILLAEALEGRHPRPPVHIFATDIDATMLEIARAARYPATALRDVPLALLDRYFYASEDRLVLTQSIRDMVRVSSHNILKDPPFSRVDLLSCRNLLIYLSGALQQRLIPVFHYALKPQGWLFLGSAENAGGREDIFEPVDQQARVYRRRGALRHTVPMPLSVDLPGRAAFAREDAGQPRTPLDLASRRIIERYAPAHVVLDTDNQVVHASSRTGRFLELAPGAPSTNIADLARRGLRPAIRAVLEGARESGKRATRRDVQATTSDDEAILVDISADPLGDLKTLLVFQESRTAPGDLEAVLDAQSEDDRTWRLEQDLDDARLQLRTTVEELETSNEELKSSNEEMMSMNEELQSANEELATVNEELKHKVDQLARANSDLQNFIESTRVPTLFLDLRTQIRRFTPAARELFRFHDQELDIGRPLGDVVTRVDHAQIQSAFERVKSTGEPVEEEAIVKEGEERYVLRALPYRDLNDEITGVVLVFSDVTKIRQTQADLARNVDLARQQSEEIIRLYQTAPVGMALVDRNRRILRCNQNFLDLTSSDEASSAGRSFADVSPELANRLEGPIVDVFQMASEIVNFEARARLGGETGRDFLIDVYPYTEDGVVIAAGLVIKEVTELRRLESELRRLMDELQHRVKNTLATVASIVNQTASSKRNRDDLVDTLKRRIGALAATHDLLTKQEWRNVVLTAILEKELSPFGHAERIKISGPVVLLPPKHALSFTMTVHELATNAAKYGALSERGAGLDVDWAVQEDKNGRRLTFTWTEQLTEPLASAQVKRSFGTRLIQNAVVHDLGGESDYELQPHGVRCTLRIPL